MFTALFACWTALVALVYNAFLRVTISVLSAGPVPKHIAFVMDGNRRYAGKHKKMVHEGHADGFEAMRRMLDVCLRLGVQCVSVYAFSIENFKRSPTEVEALMSLCKTKLEELCQHGELLDKYGVRLNVIGRKSLLPSDVQEIVRKAESATRHNNCAILNICMPYTSRDEMTTATESVAQLCIDGKLNVNDISEHDIEDHMPTALGGSTPVDILVRTSGVKRLSDYMLWQVCDNTQIHFLPTYWPDFALQHMIPVILAYQRKIWTIEPKAR
ncbi:hypothetical protein BOTBODRAFT_176038 [Botryobasidium botryosum FD-172 SS1]|uniref:Alkyl transferase n=1 Tax=Botryobasidium botryosum (strain FD-172 SS1) TaxID=930990 RepID=A0A067MBH0_BOTB1|nr:hypothetical protein BOTBODRAFT_176038 [Botryobasidium botryosum FD-172 SS1]